MNSTYVKTETSDCREALTNDYGETMNSMYVETVTSNYRETMTNDYVERL